LDRFVLGEELLVVCKIFKYIFDFNKCEEKCRPSKNRDGNRHVSADSRWEMLLKAVGQPLGTANRRGGRIAQQLSAKTWQFPFISSEY
jgi:hypothetical protein